MTANDVYAESLALHRELHGKLETRSLLKVKARRELSLLYTPGVAEPCRAIHKDPGQAWELTLKSRTVAVLSDGSAVLGLGDIGAAAALPVMEGKCILFKELAGLDAFPLCVEEHDVEGIVRVARAVAPNFGGINLEDIAAPKCFEVEARLQDLGIPVMHDDQHGTATVAHAALLNAARVVGKPLESLRVVVNGAGAAGNAISRWLLGLDSGKRLVRSVIACDKDGILDPTRQNGDAHKNELSRHNPGVRGTLADALKGADAFIGVSAAGALKPEWIHEMAPKAIVLALANPVPEVMPDEAKAAGAAVVGTGRSDFPNQVNNALAYPGVFKGALAARAARVTPAMKRAAALAIAKAVGEPTADRILPEVLDKKVHRRVAKAVARAVAKG
jgi:malate dehydrogenase (oxaloacetate-decarboxylating)